ncbi:MAG: alanine racemase [Gammaproteobacteria bacterium]|nr:alanine racemase [Gammaproteobacteria bacterium]
MTGNRSAKVSIDLAALQHNFQQVKKYAATSQVMPVIKANAYGHGMLRVAESLTSADGFAVAQLPEAIALRENGIDKPITVFQGFSNQQQLQSVFQYSLRPAISQHWQIDLLATSEQTSKIDVWLKINTGMGRLGVQLDDVETCYKRLQNINSINQTGLMTHFANADKPDHKSNQLQLERFETLSKLYTAQTSVSNSGALISNLCKKQDWVRPGIMLYGASPLSDKTAEELNLKPVMSLYAELIAINEMKKGQTVGYGDSWVCPQDMRVGIVNIGYGDGYPRHATAAPIAVNGQLCHLLGRVSMDSIAVDLRGVKAECGDLVECWGQQVSVDEVAACSETIAYELLCNLG